MGTAWGNENRLRHGHARVGKKTKTYKIWNGMMRRCYTKNNTSFAQYGAKGVSVSKDWHVFESFLKDIGEIPSNMTIDRIDNLKGYSKENCRLATTAQQSLNRRSIRWFNINGKNKCLKHWAKEFGMSYKLVHDRIQKMWPISMALTIAKGERRAKCMNRY